MSYNEIKFSRYGKKQLTATLILYVVVLTIIYFTLPNGFLGGLFAALIFMFMTVFSFPIKYVLTGENRLEIYFIFGKMKGRTIHLDKITSIKLETPNKLRVTYYKEGYSKPSSAVQELEEKDAIDMQNELLKRNSQILLN